jgi:hypothetical protein
MGSEIPVEPATPKQVAYLKFMGYPASPSMGKDKASDTIENLYEILSSDALRDSYHDRQSQWRRDRFILHRDLYDDADLQQFLDLELSELLHDHVRRRVTGASERLTKSKIRGVISSLTTLNRDWWRDSNYQQIFFECLKKMHPACCDGRSPTKTVKLKKTNEPNHTASQERRSGSVKSNSSTPTPVTIIVLVVVAILVAIKIFGGQ